MSKKRNYDLFIAKVYVNDGGWRFTFCELVSYVTNNNWILFYLCWRNGTLGDKRGITCDVWCGSGPLQ
jgi:hypothetical protein